LQKTANPVLKEDLFMAEDVAVDVVDMLALVLRGAAVAVMDNPQVNSLPDIEPKPEKKRRRKKVKAQTSAADIQENKQEIKPDESTDTPLKNILAFGLKICAAVICVLVIVICFFLAFDLPFLGRIIAVSVAVLSFYGLKALWKNQPFALKICVTIICVLIIGICLVTIFTEVSFFERLFLVLFGGISFYGLIAVWKK
jgi:cation transport ATPase